MIKWCFGFLVSAVMISCPSCESQSTVNNGRIHNGKQNFKCRDCGRQFVQDLQKKIINQATKDLIDVLVVGTPLFSRDCESDGSFRTLAATLYQWEICNCAATSERASEKKGRLTIQCDELWSFVTNKRNRQWVWLAIDVQTQEIVGVDIGERWETGAKALWQSGWPQSIDNVPSAIAIFGRLMVPSYRANGIEPWAKKAAKPTISSDSTARYAKESLDWLVRKTLSFSKKLDNHVGAIWYFIHHYNVSLPV